MAEAPELVIRPRIGLGNLMFGASMDEVRAHLGEPETVDRNNPSNWIVWSYPKFQFDLSFDKEFGSRLISLSIENKAATLFGQAYIGLESETALEMASQSPLGPYHRVNDPLGWEAEFHEADLEFRFDEDQLCLISWRVYIDDLDVVHWPAQL